MTRNFKIINNRTPAFYTSRLPLILFSLCLLFFTASEVWAGNNTSSNPKPVADFDGDGKSDISVFRPSNGSWYILNSSGGYSVVKWGLAQDVPIPGDYDGDGRTDVAVYRYGNNSWYILRSSDNTAFIRQWGTFIREEGYIYFVWDAPIPADYDGDGVTDLAVYTEQDYLPAPGKFVILQSSTGKQFEKELGTNMDEVVPADYDGDGKADIAVFRDESFTAGADKVGNWYISQSSDNSMRVEKFGLEDDKPVPADYDGDGKADIAVWRPSNGFWY
ncbi:MAG TPA: VCBS repeat-containing protein, partial [Pyrinomonadaceae bacterium]|nr:VCBS repeat-containing protein [Pyrinomonadaceae bacterium]